MRNELAVPASTRVTRVEADPAAWDRYVGGDAASTFCHLAAWREVMEDVLGHESVHLAAVDAGGAWHGVLPLVRVRSPIFGSYLVSMPFLNAGGPLGTAEARQGLAAAAVELARETRADLLELRGGGGLPGLVPTDRKIAVLLDLEESADTLWKRFAGKLRSQIRRPQKENMTATFGVDQVEPFYEVFARNMRDLGTPVLPRAFFERIARVLADHAVFAVVRFQDVPVAAGCGFVWRDRFEITWASSIREYNSRSPNMLLYWSLMEHVIGRGVRVFDFGRCTPGSNTHRFKLQWGGADEPLAWSQWSSKGVSGTPTAEGPVFRLATRTWSKLPLAVANTLGPVLARQLP
jgi:serine/alanine adding enzyme